MWRMGNLCFSLGSCPSGVGGSCSTLIWRPATRSRQMRRRVLTRSMTSTRTTAVRSPAPHSLHSYGAKTSIQIWQKDKIINLFAYISTREYLESLKSISVQSSLYVESFSVEHLCAAAGPMISCRAADSQGTRRGDHLRDNVSALGKCESVVWLIMPRAEVVFLLRSLRMWAREIVGGWHVVELMNIHAECPCGTVSSCN